MNRTEFIEILMTSTPEELNKYLHEKGKQGKAFCPVVFHGSSIAELKGERTNGKM